jgi:hypothetical protein
LPDLVADIRDSGHNVRSTTRSTTHNSMSLSRWPAPCRN